VALNTVGVSIAPILTALGVGSLAVALALQPTLTNLFAGMQISFNGRVRVGDFIELEGGQSGVIGDITWRTTQIREMSGNTIVVPNAKLVDAIVRNYTMPDPEMGFGVPVSVGYDSDLAQVERVILEEAHAVMAGSPGAAKGFEPLARVASFGADGVQFNVILRAASPGDRFVLIHELLKRLHARFKAEGIDIPFPQRVVHVRGPGALPPGD
jgi:small-conductance mechanosensitive channel